MASWRLFCGNFLSYSFKFHAKFLNEGITFACTRQSADQIRRGKSVQIRRTEGERDKYGIGVAFPRCQVMKLLDILKQDHRSKSTISFDYSLALLYPLAVLSCPSVPGGVRKHGQRPANFYSRAP